MCNPKKIILIGGILLGWIFPCTAQGPPESSTELIVRPASEARDLHSALVENRKASGEERNNPLLEGVQSVSRVGSLRGRRKSVNEEGGALEAYTLHVRDSSAFRRVLDRWRAHPSVDYAHPNYSFEVHRRVPRNGDAAKRRTNALADSLDHLDVIRAQEGWAFTRGAEEVEIGVVDTGIYLDHPDLRGEFWVNEAEDLNGNGRLDPEDLNGVDDDGNGVVDDVIGYDFVDRNTVVQEGDYEERDPDPSADPAGSGSGHGTAVAAVAAAAPDDTTAGISGVAPDTRIVPLRAFGGDGVGQSDDIAAAIVYGASVGVDVLNLSFGRNRSVPLIRDAIEYANEQGTVVVASAGNELTDDPHYPSDYPSVLSVVWLAEDGDGLPDFNRSQFGIGVDIGAPGSNVFTANFPAQQIQAGEDLSRDDLYRSTSGSSFSAPQVAGAAALLLSADSSLSPASVRSILTGAADDLEAEDWDHTTGAGLLNVSRSLSRAYPARTEIDHPDHNQGFATRERIPIVGTAIDPSFRAYSVSYAEGTKNFDDRSDPWTELSPPTPTQMLRDTLAHWNLGDLDSGEYTLRLVTHLRDGGTIEDRRRVIVDRSPPELEIQFLGSGRVQGTNGIIGDVTTDDRTRLTTTVRLGNTDETVRSEQVGYRHGIAWPEEEGRGGTATLHLEATNRSGLTTPLDTSLQVPQRRENTALLRRETMSVPRGRLLPNPVDFDGDGLREIVLNQGREGGISDTLRSFEWTGSGFAPMDTLVASLFPKDVADTDQDGLEELLLQVRGATLVLEQRSALAFPDSLVFADTTDADGSEDVLRGIEFAPLDSDSREELVATTGQQLVVLDRTGGDEDFTTVAELSNPTATTGRDSALANAYDTPEALTGDFDGDGQPDLLAGDRDGDLVLYENAGDHEWDVAWTHETDRVDAGNRFAAGDLISGGGTEFVTMTTSFQQELDTGEFEPSISTYSVWEASGDDTYERRYRLPVAGPYVNQGSMTTADVDEDGLDEVVVAHSPALLVLDRTSSGDWRVLHEHRGDEPLRSRSLVAADFSGDGVPSLLAETTGEQLVRFTVDEPALTVSPPQWTEARPLGASSAHLAWRAPGADSVTVYGGPPTGSLDRLTAVSDSSVTVDDTSERRYALRTWEGGTSSPLSSHRTIRPHAPATLTGVTYPSATSVQLGFSEVLERGLRADQFRLGEEEVPPRRLVQTSGGRAVVLHYSEDVAGQSARVRWSGVVDEDGLPVADTSADLTFPPSEQRSLFIEQADVLDPHRVRLLFNEPLDPTAATDSSRYEVRPRGTVASIQQEEENSAAVTVTVDGLVLGPNALESSLTVSEMQSADGHQLSEEGNTVRLTEPADDLSNVYVYPNPYRERDHDGLTIAGLPREASVRVYTPDGRLVRVLSVEGNRNGGRRWDLRDESGEKIPSGIYLFRVNAPEHSPVLEKAAVIR